MGTTTTNANNWVMLELPKSIPAFFKKSLFRNERNDTKGEVRNSFRFKKLDKQLGYCETCVKRKPICCEAYLVAPLELSLLDLQSQI